MLLRLRDLGIWFLLVVLLTVSTTTTTTTTTTSAFSVKPRRNSFLKSMRRPGSIFQHTTTIRKTLSAAAARDPTQQPTKSRRPGSIFKHITTIRKNIFAATTARDPKQQPTNGDLDDAAFLTNSKTLAIEEITDDVLDTNEADVDVDTGTSLYCVLNLEDISVPFLSRSDSESTFVDFSNDGAVCFPAGPVGQFKESLANFLAQSIIEVIIALSVLMSSLLVALSTVDDLEPYLPLFRTTENWIGLVLALEFAGRWISSSKDTPFFIFNPQFALDVIVVVFPLLFGLTPASFWEAQQQHSSTAIYSWLTVPSWLTAPGGLFNLELLRVLRLRRVLRDLPTFENFEKTLGIPNTGVVQEWQLQLARVLLSLFTLVSVATGLIYTTEHGVNPAISNYFDALYFGLTTLTTVGFGGKYRNTIFTLLLLFWTRVRSHGTIHHPFSCLLCKSHTQKNSGILFLSALYILYYRYYTGHFGRQNRRLWEYISGRCSHSCTSSGARGSLVGPARCQDERRGASTDKISAYTQHRSIIIIIIC
jgi:hypothetical protein